MSDFKVWETEQLSPDVWYNYPMKPFHNSQPSVAGCPAPDIAVQIYNNALMSMMIARAAQSKSSIEETLSWAENELETYSRG